nr:hypothetical protein [Mesorhizobium sp. M4B.F.Ca.ET.058.02.1.1]
MPACAVPVEWTNDRRRLAEAAAVVFHLPDYREIGDARKYPGQTWVAWSMENRRTIRAPPLPALCGISISR